MAKFMVKALVITALVCLAVDCAGSQKLETFRAVKHHLENLIARKTDAITDDLPDLKSMISTPINEWNKEAHLAIEHGTNLLMDAFRLTSEEIQRSTDNVKIDIETDKKTKKTMT